MGTWTVSTNGSWFYFILILKKQQENPKRLYMYLIKQKPKISAIKSKIDGFFHTTKIKFTSQKKTENPTCNPFISFDNFFWTKIQIISMQLCSDGQPFSRFFSLLFCTVNNKNYIIDNNRKKIGFMWRRLKFFHQR